MLYPQFLWISFIIFCVFLALVLTRLQSSQTNGHPSTSPSGRLVVYKCNFTAFFRSFFIHKALFFLKICEKLAEESGNKTTHLNCKITGRPCCIRDQAECRIVSQDYCLFLNGVYHDEATLCSQVRKWRWQLGMLSSQSAIMQTPCVRITIPRC